MTDLRRRDERVGDPAVDAAWRRAAGDEPPTHVDEAILAAARGEVRATAPPRAAPHRPSWWVRWQPLAAAAGVVGLAFVLVQLLPREEAARVPTVTGQPEAPATTEVQAAAKAQVPAPPAVPAATAPRAAEPAPAAAKSAASRESSVSDAAQVAGESRPALAGAAAPPAARSAAAQPSPEAWARRVADLHAQGDEATAAIELTAFRQAYANADDYLPPTLRPWAASVTGAESP